MLQNGQSGVGYRILTETTLNITSLILLVKVFQIQERRIKPKNKIQIKLY